MDSPLARVILATLGGYLLILVLLSVYGWLVEEYPRRPAPLANSVRIQHQIHHQEAIDALRMFSRLPKSEKNAIKESLYKDLISLEQWLEHLRETNFQMICMGELHEESTRSFLAEEFFAKVGADVLLLEATPGKLRRLIKRMEAGRDYYPLLGSDIINILHTAKDMNPDIRIHGIEETDGQAQQGRGHSNSRDQNIAKNFWAAFEPGFCHIILFGALHCTNEPNWLFHNLGGQASPSLKDEMFNVRVLGEHQNGPLEAFVYFLDETEVKKGHFVIADTRLLHPRIYELFPLLSRQTLMKYRSLVVFRP